MFSLSRRRKYVSELLTLKTYTLETNGWNLSHCSPKDLPFLLPLSVVNMGFHQQPGRRYAFVVAPEQSHLAEVHTVSCVSGDCH